MSAATSVSRLAEYYRRHGPRATIRRAVLAGRRMLFSGSSVLFYCDLPALKEPTPALPSFLRVERIQGEAELSPHDFEDITSFWNPKLARRNIKERFGKGASLWLIKSHGRLAGYGWTLQGRTMECHHLPVGHDDVQFLDFQVFPKFRGRAIDWFLMTQILQRLAAQGLARAFGEAGEWNQASLASFEMSPFRRLGLARKITIFGRTIVSWSDEKGARGCARGVFQALDPRNDRKPVKAPPMVRQGEIGR